MQKYFNAQKLSCVKTGMVPHICNACTQEAEAVRLQVQEQPQIQRDRGVRKYGCMLESVLMNLDRLKCMCLSPISYWAKSIYYLLYFVLRSFLI